MNNESRKILLVLNTFHRDSMLLKLIQSVHPLPAVSTNELKNMFHNSDRKQTSITAHLLRQSHKTKK